MTNNNQKNRVVEYKDYGGNIVKLSKDIIQQYLIKGDVRASEQEKMMFLMLCKNRGLNPFTGEAHLIKHSSSQPATMVVGKDAFTTRAAGHRDFNGMKAGIVAANNKGETIYRDGSLKLDGEQIVGGWAEVYRKSWEHPIRSEVAYSEYEARKKDGQPNATWKKMGATMIRKVALVQALREAFPDQFGGLYDSSEMSQATDKVDLASEIEKNVTPPPEMIKVETPVNNVSAEDIIDFEKADSPSPPKNEGSDLDRQISVMVKRAKELNLSTDLIGNILNAKTDQEKIKHGNILKDAIHLREATRSVEDDDSG